MLCLSILADITLPFDLLLLLLLLRLRTVLMLMWKRSLLLSTGSLGRRLDWGGRDLLLLDHVGLEVVVLGLVWRRRLRLCGRLRLLLLMRFCDWRQRRLRNLLLAHHRRSRSNRGHRGHGGLVLDDMMGVRTRGRALVSVLGQGAEGRADETPRTTPIHVFLRQRS